MTSTFFIVIHFLVRNSSIICLDAKLHFIYLVLIYYLDEAGKYAFKLLMLLIRMLSGHLKRNDVSILVDVIIRGDQLYEGFLVIK